MEYAVTDSKRQTRYGLTHSMTVPAKGSRVGGYRV